MRHPSYKEEAVARALLAYIERNYRQPIAPRDVAAALHYEPHHLAHVVKRAVGFSLGDLIVKRRLKAAAQLLSHTNISIGSIAARVGFRSLAYFSRKFSAVIGVSPTRYRRSALCRSLHDRALFCGQSPSAESPSLRAFSTISFMRG